MGEIILDGRVPTKKLAPNPPEIDLKSIPNFEEYRVQNDAVMVPDRGFTKQLKCLDPELGVVWNWGQNIWEIWRFPKDKKDSHHVLSVRTKGKTYRELGTDILLKLQESWQLGNLTVNQLASYLDELDNQVQRRKAKDFSDKIQDIARETMNFASGVLQVQVPRMTKIGRIVANG